MSKEREAEKGYDRPAFVAALRALGVTPHVAPNVGPHQPPSAIDGRTSRDRGFEVSQRYRKKVEEIYEWEKTTGHRGGPEVFRVLVPTNYVAGYVVMPWLVGAAILHYSGGKTCMGVKISEKTHWNAVAAGSGAFRWCLRRKHNVPVTAFPYWDVH